MKKVAHALAKFYLILEIPDGEEDFQCQFDKETIVASKIELTTPDGTVHRVKFADLIAWEQLDEQDEEIEQFGNSDQPVKLMANA